MESVSGCLRVCVCVCAEGGGVGDEIRSEVWNDV